VGLLDLPAGVFAWLDDAVLGALTPWTRLLIWGAMGGAASMALYVLLSPQRRIAAAKQRAAAARGSLLSHDGDFAVASGLAVDSLKAALAHLGLSLGPVILASLPVLCLLLWLSNNYGQAWPSPGALVEITAGPNGFSRTIQWPRPGASFTLQDPAGLEILTLPPAAAVGVLHKRQWWNQLVGNPTGYLPPDHPYEQITMRLPIHRYLPFGPDWLAGWEVMALLSMVVTSLAIKLLFRIN